MRPYGDVTKHVLLLGGLAGVLVIVAAAPGVVLAGKLFEFEEIQQKEVSLQNYKF